MSNTDPRSVSVALAYPVTVDAVEYKSLSVRPARVIDQLRAMKAGSDEASRGVFMVAQLTGVADNVIEQLDLADFGRVSKVVSGFMDLSETPTA